jgi:thiaminase/transcriptional activator TenA
VAGGSTSDDTAPDGLFAGLRDACAGEWHDYTHHPFLMSLAAGTLPKAAFRAYLIQDYIFLRHFARAYGLAAYKAESLAEIRAALSGLSAIVDVEIGLHEKYCAGWGVDSATLEAAPEDDATMAYTRYVLERGMAGDLLDLYVALAPCIVGYGEIGARLLADKNTRLEDNPYRDWIEMYGGAEYQEIAEQAVRYLDNIAATRGAPARRKSLIATFRQATRLETAFWQIGLVAAD